MERPHEGLAPAAQHQARIERLRTRGGALMTDTHNDLREIVHRMDCGILTSRRISHDEARESAQRLINSHFGSEPVARATIPANPDGDDDLILLAYIKQQELLTSR
jgi:hypothetical protein